MLQTIVSCAKCIKLSDGWIKKNYHFNIYERPESTYEVNLFNVNCEAVKIQFEKV